MMLRRSSTRIPLFVLIGQTKWQIYAFLFSIGQEKNLSSENTVPVRINISRNDFYKAFCSYFWEFDFWF
jgi:hypothetical protein